MKDHRASELACVTALMICLLTQAVMAQYSPPVKPFARTGDMLLSDSFNDKIWRLQDLDLDGTCNQAGEITTFYDSASPGAISLVSNNQVAIDPSGVAYVCDSSADIILKLVDLNGDGDAQDSGAGWTEFSIWFDGHAWLNLSGIDMAVAYSLLVDASGVIWVAASDATGVGVDMVLRLEDLDQDGDANDANEASIFVQFPGGVLADHIITDIGLNPQDLGAVYFVENGTAPGIKGVWRCFDTDGSGAIDPGEVNVYYQPNPFGSSSFHWGVAFAPDGTLYLTDSGNDMVWKGLDTNLDNVITVGIEDAVFFQAPGSSTMWRPDVASDGSVYVTEDFTPDGVWRLSDQDGDGVALTPGLTPPEWVRVYDESVGAEPAIGIRGMCFYRAPRIDFPDSPSASVSHLFNLEGAMGDFYYLWVSTGFLPAPGIPIPPLGNLELGVFPPHVYFPLLSGVLPASGTLSIPVPAGIFSPGTAFTLQAVIGTPFRLQFSTGKSITFVP